MQEEVTAVARLITEAHRKGGMKPKQQKKLVQLLGCMNDDELCEALAWLQEYEREQEEQK